MFVIYIRNKSLKSKKRIYIKFIIIFCSLVFLKTKISFLLFKTEITIDNRIKYDIEDNIYFSNYSSTINIFIINI